MESSSLNRLPIEIREQIYAYVVPLHISSIERPLELTSYGVHKAYHTYHHWGERHLTSIEAALILISGSGLVQTCLALRREIFKIFFSTNWFSIRISVLASCCGIICTYTAGRLLERLHFFFDVLEKGHYLETVNKLVLEVGSQRHYFRKDLPARQGLPRDVYSRYCKTGARVIRYRFLEVLGFVLRRGFRGRIVVRSCCLHEFQTQMMPKLKQILEEGSDPSLNIRLNKGIVFGMDVHIIDTNRRAYNYYFLDKESKPTQLDSEDSTLSRNLRSQPTYKDQNAFNSIWLPSATIERPVTLQSHPSDNRFFPGVPLHEQPFDRHELLHNEEYAPGCDYRNHWVLRTRAYIKGKTQPQHCQVCGEYLLSKNSLRKHQKIKHWNWCNPWEATPLHYIAGVDEPDWAYKLWYEECRKGKCGTCEAGGLYKDGEQGAVVRLKRRKQVNLDGCWCRSRHCENVH